MGGKGEFESVPSLLQERASFLPCPHTFAPRGAAPTRSAYARLQRSCRNGWQGVLKGLNVNSTPCQPMEARDGPMPQVRTTKHQAEERRAELPPVRAAVGTPGWEERQRGKVLEHAKGTPRPSNPALCSAFRLLLTSGFYATYTNGERAAPGSRTHQLELAATKAWRGEVWKAFAEIERRLCPTNKDGGPR